MSWTTICNEADIAPGTGVCALLGDEQVAIFKMLNDHQLFAISNYDPIGKANVLSRGITGSLGDAMVVASPLYKQHFNLETGACLEDEAVSVKTYDVRINEGEVQLSSS